MKKHTDEGAPCAMMENLLQDVAAGRVRGIRRWYAVFHATHCSQCGNFLQRMTALVHVLRSKDVEAPASAMDRLRTQLHEIDAP